MFAAVDTNFPLALAEKDEAVTDTRQTFRDRRFRAKCADYQKLVFELGKFDLHPPVIATSKEIVRKFFK